MTSDELVQEAMRHQYGYGVPVSKQKAAYYYKQAASLGNAHAKKELEAFRSEDALTRSLIPNRVLRGDIFMSEGDALSAIEEYRAALDACKNLYLLNPADAKKTRGIFRHLHLSSKSRH